MNWDDAYLCEKYLRKINHIAHIYVRIYLAIINSNSFEINIVNWNKHTLLKGNGKRNGSYSLKVCILRKVLGTNGSQLFFGGDPNWATNGPPDPQPHNKDK